MRSIKAGELPWSPKYRVLKTTIDLWKCVMKWKKGCNTSRNTMKRYVRNAGLVWKKVKNKTVEESKKELAKAREKFNRSRENFLNGVDSIMSH